MEPTYQGFTDFMTRASESLLELPMEFKGINRGTMTYTSKETFQGLEVCVQGSECYIGDYDYAPEEPLKNLTQFEHCYITLIDSNYNVEEVLMNR